MAEIYREGESKYLRVAAFDKARGDIKAIVPLPSEDKDKQNEDIKAKALPNSLCTAAATAVAGQELAKLIVKFNQEESDPTWKPIDAP